MAIKDSLTEQQIKDTAKKLFFREGRFHATTQEIAEAAGVNRTLVHYYFRSRDLLFDQILKEAILKTSKRTDIFYRDDICFKEKVALFIDLYMEQAIDFPYLDSYIVSRINEGFAESLDLFADSGHHERTKAFFKLVEDEIGRGTIAPVEPIQFFMNLFGLLFHPVSLQPLYKKVFQMNEVQYQQLLADRKAIILKILFV